MRVRLMMAGVLVLAAGACLPACDLFVAPTRGAYSPPPGDGGTAGAGNPANAGLPPIRIIPNTPRPGASAPSGGAASPGASPGASPDASPSAGASAAPTPDPRLPASAPTIEGDVLSSRPASGGDLYLAEVSIATADGTNQAVVRINTGTVIWRQGADGGLTRGGAGDLELGATARVWAGGPVQESFPIRFDAGTVVILPAAAEATDDPNTL